MVNYANGKIYKIVCNITGEVYVGSTAEPTLARRLAHHCSQSKQYNVGKLKSHTASFYIIERGDFYIDLLEMYPCSCREELFKKEREWYDRLECINKIRPYRSVEDKQQDMIEYRKTNHD